MAYKKKVLFLVPYPLSYAPSQRFRVELFLPYSEQNGIVYDIQSFLDDNTFHLLYKKGKTFRKFTGILRGFWKRFILVLFGAKKYHYVFIHREASPLGPPIFEWMLASLLKKKIIYDFDDALWIADSKNNLLNVLKCNWKIKYICKWSYRIAAGNSYLYSFASRYNENVKKIPTSVDTVNHHNRIKDQNTNKIVIGWTGSHSTLKYLDSILPVLKKVIEMKTVSVTIICNQPPQFELPNLRYITWKESTEIDDLLKMNIGIMPLERDKWSEGKCGFKLIQYLSLGIPAIASPVGVNTEIIEDGKNGFLCQNLGEWERAMIQLIENKVLRHEFGEKGREKVIGSYSIQANAASFFGFFE